MQYVNDDMDELFRKAAKDYPLDTSGSDWSKVASALQQEETLPEKKKNGKFLWLLLLLPLGLVCNHFWNNGDQGDNASVHQSSHVHSLEPTGASTPRAGEASPAGMSGKTAGTPENRLATDHEATAGKDQTNRTSVSAAGINGHQNIFIKGSSASKNIADNKKLTANKVKVRSTGSPSISAAPSGKGAVKGSVNPTVNTVMPSYGIKDVQDASRLNLFLGKIDHAGTWQPHSPALLMPGFEPIVEQQPAIRVTNRRKRVYLSLMGGVDATTIHFQKVKDAGYDYGALLGYQLNRKWSIEAGVFVDRKFYYTDGQYFNSAKLYLPPNSKITEVNGNCKMIEIPVTLRYTFSNKAHSSWFAAAGISSYLMKKEDYAYKYYYGGSNTYAVHRWTYSNSSRNYLSVLNLSAGYTHPIGRLVDLRVEPYVKIPVAGLGYNSIRMVSAGIHLGLTKDLF